MSSRLPITRAEALEGPSVQFIGEDGFPTSILLPALFVQDARGRWFQQPNRVLENFSEDGFVSTRARFDLQTARDIAEKALEIGIEEACWVEVEEADIREYLRGPYALGGVA